MPESSSQNRLLRQRNGSLFLTWDVSPHDDPGAQGSKQIAGQNKSQMNAHERHQSPCQQWTSPGFSNRPDTVKAMRTVRIEQCDTLHANNFNDDQADQEKYLRHIAPAICQTGNDADDA